MSKLKIAVLLFCALLGSIAVGAAIQLYVIQSTGHYEGNEVLVEPGTIAWDNVIYNIPVSKTVDITNNGAPITLLGMDHAVTSGTINDYTLIWDLEDTPLNTGATETATFTLTILDGEQGDFQIDITVNDKG